MTFTASLCNVSCQCGHIGPIEEFTERPVSGSLPDGVYQCLACNRAWELVKGKRRYTGDLYPPILLQPVGARL